MSRFVVKTPFDSIDCDGVIIVAENILEVGYKVGDKFRHELIRTDYYRVIDNSPEITEEEFMQEVEHQSDLDDFECYYEDDDEFYVSKNIADTKPADK